MNKVARILEARKNSALMIVLFLLGCSGSRWDGGERSDLKHLKSELNKAASTAGTNATRVRIPVSVNATLVLASPYALSNARQKKWLATTLGSGAATELEREGALADHFQIYLVANDHVVDSMLWDGPLFPFNDVLTVDLRNARSLDLVLSDKTLVELKAKK